MSIANPPASSASSAPSSASVAFAAPRLQRYFDEYASFHQNWMNQATHFIGIPMITFALLGLLAKVVLFPITDWLNFDLGLVLWAGALLWYLTLDWRYGIPFAVLCLGLYFIARDIPQLYLWIAFVVGWIFQFIGHIVYEKKSPAFYKNFEHLLIGPLWLFAKTVRLAR
jgi:uncharacterized membrane protein YGL010W